MSLKYDGCRYYLVIVDVNDFYSLPLYVADTWYQCAMWLNGDVRTLYNYRRYQDYEVLVVKDVDYD